MVISVAEEKDEGLTHSEARAVPWCLGVRNTPARC